MEQKYQIGTKSGFIMWNIEKLTDDLENFDIYDFDTRDLLKANSLFVKQDYAMLTDLSKPLIIVELCPGKDKLIDGSHRLYKAKKLGVPTVKAYYLKQSQHIKYILNYNSELYNKVVSEF